MYVVVVSEAGKEVERRGFDEKEDAYMFKAAKEAEGKLASVIPPPSE